MAEKTKRECQTMIFNAAVKNGISPRLIALKLLAQGDKDAMLSGEIDFECLNAHVAAWVKIDAPDLVDHSEVILGILLKP